MPAAALLLALLGAPPGAGASCADDPVPTLTELTDVLRQCGDLSELRLGFHSHSSSTNRAAAHAVAAAARTIEAAGGAACLPRRVHVSYKPVGFDRAGAVRAALELVGEERVHAVVGGGSSTITIIASSVFAVYGIPQLGHSATSPLLSDKAAHPYFSRVVPPDTYQGTALAGIVRQLGWRRIGVVSTTDEYALEISRVFRAALDEPPVVLVQYALLASYDGISLRPQCETVLQSRVRVVALLAGSVEAARAYVATFAEVAAAAPPPLRRPVTYLGIDG